jgi:hypothetical protein
MNNTDTTETTEIEPINLAELSDMKLTYDDGDGNRQEVRFDDDNTNTDTETTNEQTTVFPNIELPEQPAHTLQ